jgi:hypothetical protein
MLSRLCGMLESKSQKNLKKDRRIRLQLEGLEDRLVRSVTYFGGNLLPHVEVQGLYVGDQWSSNPTLYNQTGYLEGFLGSVVNSSYMDALTNAGYGVGRGSSSAGRISLANLPAGSTLTDGTMRAWLSAYISDHTLQPVDANRLYVLFVEPNVIVKDDGGATSSSFRGYHTAFAGPGGTVRYAVIAYPRGTVNNASVSFLSDIDSITKTASHEIAEAATDPDIGYSTKGWYDANFDGEIGDINNDQVARLNGFAIQRVIEKNDQNMTPAGARADRQVNFVLMNNSDLWEYGPGGWTYLTTNVTSISDQSIDLQGHTMVDVIVSGGSAWEYHDGTGWTYLWNGAVSAKAGQGESFLLFGDGSLWEFKDKDGSWWHLDDNVASIDAGTDRYGVNAVAEVMPWGTAWEWSDTTGWHFIASGVQSVSMGQQGIATFVTTGGDAFWYGEAYGGTSYLSSGVLLSVTGVDQAGNYMIDLVYSNGDNWEYRGDRGWNFVDWNVRSLSKAVAGNSVHVSNADNAWFFDNNDNYFLLTSDAAQAA